MKTIPIFAHRGVSKSCVENTMLAFKKAQAIGVDGIELDVQFSKDGVLVVFHDLDLIRLVGKRRSVADCSLDELRSYKLGSRLQRIFYRHQIVTLQEVLDWAIEEQIPLNIELKESLLLNEQAFRKFLKTIHVPKNSHFSSFFDQLLMIVKEERPEFETAYIVTKKFNWAAMNDNQFFDTIHAHKKYYKRQYLKYCDEAKVGIRFYGVTGNEGFIKNPHPAVLGWITDYPEKVLKAQ